MTFSKLLKSETTPSGYVVEAVESANKPFFVPYYNIYITRENDPSAVVECIPCAKTTWREKFRRAVTERG